VGPPDLGYAFPFVLVMTLGLASTACAGLLAGRGPLRTAAALTLGIAISLSPLLQAPDPPLFRFMLAMLGMLCVLRVVDLARGARVEGARRRAWFALTAFDVRQTSPAQPALDPGLLLAVVGYGALATAAGALLVVLRPLLAGPAAFVARSLVGAVFCYALVDAVVASIRLGYRLAGVRTPEFHRAPILSRTLREFWGARWNRPVHEWLERHLFFPLARRKWVLGGVAAAFAGSTALHLWLAFVAVPVLSALSMAAFFVVQGLLLAVERALGVARWSSAASRTWTLGCFFLTSPLFVEPMLQVVQL
jgi:hypothetical protein